MAGVTPDSSRAAPQLTILSPPQIVARVNVGRVGDVCALDGLDQIGVLADERPRPLVTDRGGGHRGPQPAGDADRVAGISVVRRNHELVTLVETTGKSANDIGADARLVDEGDDDRVGGVGQSLQTGPQR